MEVCNKYVDLNTYILDPVFNFNSMARVRERTIPTERPPLVGEVIANFLRIEG
jgi:hypothetical protein